LRDGAQTVADGRIRELASRRRNAGGGLLFVRAPWANAPAKGRARTEFDPLLPFEVGPMNER